MDLSAQYTFSVVIAPLTAAVSVGVIVYIWRYRTAPGALALIGSMVAVAAWLILNTLELADPTEAGTVFWAKVTYPFITVAPVLWFAFAGVAFAIAMLRHRLFKLKPMARDALIDRMGDGMLVLDEHDWVVDINLAAREMLGTAGADAIGCSVAQVLSPWPVLVELLREAASAQTDVVVEGDGARRHFDLRVSPLTDRRGRATGRLIVIRDITRRKRAEEALQKAHDELEQRVAERTSELTLANEQLNQQIAERTRVEAEIQALNATLERRVASRTRDLSALYEVTATTNEFIDLQATLDRLLEKTLEIVGSRVGLLHLLDEDGGTLRLAVQQGLPAGLAGYLKTQPQESALWDRVMNDNQTLVVPDLLSPAGDQRIVPTAYLDAVPTYIGVPIHAKGRLLGVLSVFGESVQKFSAEDIALLAVIADHIGVALETARLRRRAEQAAVMEERQRLARELHDSVTQALYSLTLFAEAGQDSIHAADLSQAEHYLARLGETAQQALKEMRLLIYELRPLTLEQEGLVGALRQRLETVERRARVATQLVVDAPLELPADIEQVLYRIAQEALNNALKHSAATHVAIHISTKDGVLRLEVKDNGQGFDLEAFKDRTGIGLASMRERAENLGGQLLIDTHPGQGTRVEVLIPLPDL